MSKTRSQKAYESIRARILDWELRPGVELREAELAEALEVSRTPIRDALQRLSNEGLVRLVPGKGAFVSEISIADVIELFELREALEVQASCLAARSPNSHLLEDMRKRLTAEGQRLLDQGDVAAYYSLTTELGYRIVELTNNQRLVKALEDIWTQIYRIRRIASDSPERLRESIAEHDRIVSAIIDQDEDKADLETRHHLENSLQHILTNARYLTRSSAK